MRWLSRILNRNACVYQTDDAMFVYSFNELILGFRYNDLAWETGGYELALTVTLALQANQPTKCAGHCKVYFIKSSMERFSNPIFVLNVIN